MTYKDFTPEIAFNYLRLLGKENLVLERKMICSCKDCVKVVAHKHEIHSKILEMAVEWAKHNLATDWAKHDV